MSNRIDMPPIGPKEWREGQRKANEAHDQKIKRLIDAARAGNGEPLARYIERGSDHRSPVPWFNEELRAFFAELVGKTKKIPRPDRKRTGRNQSSAAFYRNRSIAWYVAKILLYAWHREGMPENTKPKLAEKAIDRAYKKFGLSDRKTVQRAWENNPDLHDVLTVEMLRSAGPDAWKDPT